MTTAMNLDFGEALHALRRGARVERAGWNGRGMWLRLVEGATFEDVVGKTQVGGINGDVIQEHAILPFIAMWTVQEEFIPWQPSTADLLATDWRVVLDGRNGE